MKESIQYDFEFVIKELQTKSIHDKYPYAHPIKTKNKTVNMSLGRIFFNECLPEDYPLLNEPINKPKLDFLVKDLIDKYPPDLAGKTLSNMLEKFYKISTISPSTFAVDVFIPSEEWITKKKEFQKKAVNYDPAQFQKEAQELTIELVKEIEDKGYRIHNILKGGIKGNPINDWKNLLVAKGYVIDIENNLLGPIVHGISEGFTKKEYFDSVAEARRGFYYKASLTAIPGYLARKLTMAGANITLTHNDCGTKIYLEVLVTKNNIGNITGRYMNENGKLIETTTENLEPYIGQKIKIRSPLYCQAKKNQICSTCFGTLADKVQTDRIGILAAGVINQVTLNELMKMRHKTSQINAKEVDFPKIMKNSRIEIQEIKDLIQVDKKQIFAKVPITVAIDLSDYHESEIIETEKYYQLPGLLTLFPDDNPEYTIEFPFEFQVKLYKPKEIFELKNTLEFHYQPQEIIISQDYIIDQTDPTVVRRLFDAGFKYIKTPEGLVELIAKRLPSMDLVYIETVVQNMFRSKVNPQNNCRLVHYKNCEVYSQKQLPFLNSWVNSLSFENIDKGVRKGLLTEKDINYDPIEKIVIEKFS